MYYTARVTPKACFHKIGQPIRYKMKPNHPPKVNVSAGISRRGATQVVIFRGILTATRQVDILEAGLLPFLEFCISRGP